MRLALLFGSAGSLQRIAWLPSCGILNKHGFEKISKPTKSEICQFEVKGQSHKSYSYNMLEQHPHLLSAYHLEHKYNLKNGKLFLTPQELDYIVYGKLKKAI